VGKAKVAEAALQEARATIQKLSDANQALSQIVSKRGEGQQGDESLFAEIEAIGKALEQSQKEGQRLSKLVAEREDEKAKLLHDVCLVLHMYFTNVKKKNSAKSSSRSRSSTPTRKSSSRKSWTICARWPKRKPRPWPSSRLARRPSCNSWRRTTASWRGVSSCWRRRSVVPTKRTHSIIIYLFLFYVFRELLLADTKNRLSKYETNVAKVAPSFSLSFRLC